MKWYKHDPARFLEGVIGLTLEERGAYITLIDLLYARAPLGNVTDELAIAAMDIDPRMWRRLKASLMAKGKIHETATGLMTNGVISELTSALRRMRVTPADSDRLLEKQTLNPDTTTTTTTKKISKKRSSLGTHIDENWLASNDDLAFARQEGLTAEQIAEEEAKFRDYWKARPGAGGRKRDWPATWRNWVRNNKQPHRLKGGREPTLWQRKQQEIEDAKQCLDASIARHRAAREGGSSDETSDGVVPFPDRTRS